MINKDRVFVFGASGHAKVVIDIMEKQGVFEIACLFDDDASLKGKSVFGYPVAGGKEELSRCGVKKGIVAIGSNAARKAVADWLVTSGYELVTAIHPSAEIARGVTIGDNCVVMAGAVINSDCTIGNHVIVNTSASIDHDCFVADGVHVAPGATLCGTVKVGAGTFICAGATVIPNLEVGSGVIVGAGSTVVGDLPDKVLVVSSPARVIKHI
ncbi:acetyltransferase [Geomonas edaphica]|uniref:acetyltransferase n=1 Tax=Geomonas edaphica TaxID=2570226 RepID=UPI0010A879CE|nr:acetyltransferase [Geomonas edaphica]